MAGTEFVKMTDVRYTYPLSDHPALDHLDLVLERGKFYGVIGENAAGKTTLCNLIRGLCPHFYLGTLEGEALIDGQDVRTIDDQKLAVEIGFVFQNPFVQMSGIRETVFEEVGVGLENLGIPREEMMRRIVEVCRALHIENLLDKNPLELSGGQCQRVAFASIIAMDADVMVIDEPTSQLDPEGTEDVFEIIQLLKGRDKTIILVEHKIDLIAEYCDEVIVMKDGRIAMKGDTSTVLSDPRLQEWGAPVPAAARLGHALRAAGCALPRIPITNSEAAALVRGL
ncbi:MAG TPA: energy-coupling factor ABC transporter ATP-binding protein [Candidatus Fournierella excrementigallinarum]|nr:energy-coupling factor ABC transporter ATP-binding protein [Candidatus Fournierella excrementigallinarum]